MIRRIRAGYNRRNQTESNNHSTLDFQRRLQLARQFGNSTIAYSTVCQPGLRYHHSRNGFIAFDRKWGFEFALGDPVVENNSVDEIVGDFVDSCKRRPCFVNISKSTAAACADRGYYINQMGIDTWLPLDRYDFRGKEKEPFRYAANWLARRDYRIEELSFEQIDSRVAAYLSRRWRVTRTIKRREVSFMNRPLVLEDEPDVRRFFLFDRDDQLQALVFLDPVYDAGEITGYVTVIKRRDPDAPAVAEQGIMKHCVDKLKDEGRQTLRLGLSPLASMTDRSFKRKPADTSWLELWLPFLVGQSVLLQRERACCVQATVSR